MTHGAHRDDRGVRDPIWEGIATNRPAIADGVIRVPDGPGFDISLDPDALQRYIWT